MKHLKPDPNDTLEIGAKVRRYSTCCSRDGTPCSECLIEGVIVGEIYWPINEYGPQQRNVFILKDNGETVEQNDNELIRI